MTQVHQAPDPAATRAAGAKLLPSLKAGDVVLLQGPLGAGKTTFVRGLLQAAGHAGPIRSPTYNLLQSFEGTPPILHADLYRVKTAAGLGIEDYLETHICLIEWPDRLGGFIASDQAWLVGIELTQRGRTITIRPPMGGKGVS